LVNETDKGIVLTNVLMIVSINVQFMLFLFQKFVKYVKNLLSICACGDYCCLTTKGDEATGQVGADSPTGIKYQPGGSCQKIRSMYENNISLSQCLWLYSMQNIYDDKLVFMLTSTFNLTIYLQIFMQSVIKFCYRKLLITGSYLGTSCLLAKGCW